MNFFNKKANSVPVFLGLTKRQLDTIGICSDCAPESIRNMERAWSLSTQSSDAKAIFLALAEEVAADEKAMAVFVARCLVGHLKDVSPQYTLKACRENLSLPYGFSFGIAALNACPSLRTRFALAIGDLVTNFCAISQFDDHNWTLPSITLSYKSSNAFEQAILEMLKDMQRAGFQDAAAVSRSIVETGVSALKRTTGGPRSAVKIKTDAGRLELEEALLFIQQLVPATPEFSELATALRSLVDEIYTHPQGIVDPDEVYFIRIEATRVPLGGFLHDFALAYNDSLANGDFDRKATLRRIIRVVNDRKAEVRPSKGGAHAQSFKLLFNDLMEG